MELVFESAISAQLSPPFLSVCGVNYNSYNNFQVN